MEKLIIVGNGFDIAHGLKTTYKDFVNAVNDPILDEFRILVNNLNSQNEEEKSWFSFEENIERLAISIYEKNFSSDLFNYEEIENQMKEYNSLYLNISNLLYEYLNNEYNNNTIQVLESIKNEIDSNSFAISFNYTDTIKFYTKNYSFIHGSLKEDNHIILGFGIEQISDLATNEYSRYYKPTLREKLNFIRFLKSKGVNDSNNKLLQEFERHLMCMFSGRGGYDFPIKSDSYPGESEIDIGNCSDIIVEYAKQNNFFPARSKELDFSNITEIVIMGHGLESDKAYFREIFESVYHLEKLTIYTFLGEDKNELSRKIRFLRELSKINEIVVKEYE